MRGNMPPAFKVNEDDIAIIEALSTLVFKEKWYQRDESWWEDVLVFLLCVVPSLLMFGFKPPITVAIVSIVLYIFSAIADIYTTYQGFYLQPEFKKKGVPFPLRETNPFLSNVPSLRELVFGIPTLVVLGASLISFVIPGFVWATTYHKLRVTASNHRLNHLTRYQLSLYKRLAGEDRTKQRDTRIANISQAIPTVTG